LHAEQKTHALPEVSAASEARAKRITRLAIARLGLGRRVAAAAFGRAAGGLLGEPCLRLLGVGQLGLQLGPRLLVFGGAELSQEVGDLLVLLGKLRLKAFGFFGLLNEGVARRGFAGVIFGLDLAEIEPETTDDQDGGTDRAEGDHALELFLVL